MIQIQELIANDVNYENQGKYMKIHEKIETITTYFEYIKRTKLKLYNWTTQYMKPLDRWVYSTLTLQ